jgi:hypothetical protein
MSVLKYDYDKGLSNHTRYVDPKVTVNAQNEFIKDICYGKGWCSSMK